MQPVRVCIGGNRVRRNRVRRKAHQIMTKRGSLMAAKKRKKLGQIVMRNQSIRIGEATKKRRRKMKTSLILLVERRVQSRRRSINYRLKMRR